MVRDYWDCSKGAYYYHSLYNGNYYRRNYGCQGDDRGDLMVVIDDLFNSGIEIDRSRSYYRNYILHIEAHVNEQTYWWEEYELTVSF